jgi:16S rRNA C967 or C1407 C5-methylase (RsmB/RsmF family)/NOL1/NOP2/fmu family ribosome biogenesis protein
MLPARFQERIKEQKYIDALQLEEALNRPSPVSIRINPEKWKGAPTNSDRVPWSDWGYYLDTRPSFTFDPLFHSGCYYPQEASGMFLEQAYKQLVTDSHGVRVLDLCGSPGGKSTHLSSLISDNGFLVANEVIKSRAGILAENITKWGIGNTLVTNNDPMAFRRLNNYFDLILADVPCSGEGMFSDLTIRSEWSPENAALCAERQRRIIMDIWPSLKENGILIYSTCTFNPSENEENIKWIVQNTGSSSLSLDISKFNGIQEISYKDIIGYGFYPGRIRGEGLFISVFRKPDESPGKTKQLFIKNDNQLTGNDSKITEKFICTSLTNLYRHDDIVYDLSLPVEEYILLKNYLRIIKGGTALYKIRKDDFTPLHELGIYCKMKKNAFPSVEIDFSQAISFLKKENIELKNASKGWILLKYRGINLGFVKNIGKRVNNYFPTGWRIRMNVPIDIQKRQIDWNITD